MRPRLPLSPSLLLSLSLVLPHSATAAEPAPRSPETIVSTFCTACHGAQLTGERAPSLLDDRWLHGSDDASILRSIAEGFPLLGMPGYGAVLTTTEQRDLLAYLRRQAAEFAAGRIAPPPAPPAEAIESQLHSFRIETLVEGLERPWGFAFLPDGRILVTERPGRLRVIENGRLLPAPITGLPPIYVRQDGGLLDVIAHPDFANNGWIYLAYTEAGPVERTSMTVVIRGRIREDRWTDQETIFRADPKFYNTDTSHYGCRFLFDPTGHLFFTIGDRGDAAQAQDLASPFGKILRVTADGRIPPDNPFVNRPDALGSVWSYGHRHVQGLSYHPVTGQLWTTEHGPVGGDELNRIEPGRNYGWPLVSAGVDPTRTYTDDRPGLTPPNAQWTPSIAPSGIAFYTGDKFPGWKNQLLVAGLMGQQLRRVETDGDRVVRQEVLFQGFGRVRTVTVRPDGLPYLLFDGPPGRFARLVPVATDPAVAAARPAVRRSVFGRNADGVEIESYTLTNRAGATAQIITHGAIIADLRLPDRSGVLAGVVEKIVPSQAGFATGFKNAAAVIGRFANRIAHARFPLDGRIVEVTPNAAPHQLHGGRRGFDKKIWLAEPPSPNGPPRIRLNLVSPAGDEGFPGTVNVSVTYTLTEDNTLRLDYEATTDAPTPINLTNHAYFNLGSGGDVTGYELTLAADRYTVVDEKLIPTGEIAPVRGTPLDFTTPTRLGVRASQLGPKAIYDHNFVLNRPAGDATLRFATRVYDPASGRQMETWTTEPGVQLYTSKLSETPVIARVGFFCLETQHFPDSVNHPHFPSTILRPGKTFRSTTEYRFTTR